MEKNGENPTDLTKVIQIFKDCRDRSFQQVPGGYPQPDAEKDIAMPLETYRTACQTVEAEELLPQTLMNRFLKSVDNVPLPKLAKRYPSGAKICLAFVPVQIRGVPGVELHMLEVDSKGLTRGYTFDPGYYFLVLPAEIQSKCTFRVPNYENFNYPTEAERDELKKRLIEALDSLKALVDKKNKAA